MQNIISFNFIILYTMITKISKRAVSSITHCTYEIFLDHKEIKIFFFSILNWTLYFLSYKETDGTSLGEICNVKREHY